MSKDISSQEQLNTEIELLKQRIGELENDKEDLEILLDTITEHSTDLENEIYQKNQIMLKYLQQVKLITEAAAEVEGGTFAIASLNDVSAREDELGQLARVFQNMAEQVKIRESKLQQQVEELRIEIDKGRQQKQVAEIVQTDSFKNLKQKIQKIKDSRTKKNT
ncbi:HAMP domain-containing protein [Aphanothece sacrum]|nr:HAMP domain-containing protein [Aphanothece sacrum]